MGLRNASEEVVTLGTLSEMTGFPIEYIKKELLTDSDAEQALTIEELRKKVLAYLDSNF